MLAGCSSGTVAGEPVPAPSAGGGSSSTAAPSGQPTLPARPRELRLDGVNPCTLFPEGRRPEFEVNQPPVGPSMNGKMVDCSFSSQTGGVSIDVDTQRGAAYFLGDTKSSFGVAIAVADFPGVSGYPKAIERSTCFVEIDVADGQNLSIQYNDRRRPGPAVLCPIAQKVALVALDALKAQKK